MTLGFTVALVVLLVLVERREPSAERTRWIRILKPLASAGFIAHALGQGALTSSYGTWIVVGLLASWVGDVCLLSARARWFTVGLVAFLLAHVAYITAFLGQQTSGIGFIAAALSFGSLTWFIRTRLRPHVPAKMRLPVDLYMTVINAMVVFAISTWHAGGSWMIAVGAIAFYFSDLLVARDRFVAGGWPTRAGLLVLYYAAQLLLGSTCPP